MLRMASACTSVSLNALISAGFGSSTVRMILITSSRFRYAINKPPRTSSRCSICVLRKLVRRIRTSRRWSSHSRRHSASPTTLGMRPLISTLRFSGILFSSSVSRNNDSIIRAGSTFFDFGSITMRTSSADSSLMSPTSGSFFWSSSSATFSIRRDFCTRKGISVTTTTQVPRVPSSCSHRARTRNEPRPVV